MIQNSALMNCFCRPVDHYPFPGLNPLLFLIEKLLEELEFHQHCLVLFSRLLLVVITVPLP
uniref:Uncharacterized protein n=1 Tax=Arundo donax TaxID=35708 RepID=A0A0A9G5J1_ARUDO